MGADEGLSLGATLLLTAFVCSILLLATRFGINLINGQMGNVGNVNSSVKESDFSAFNDKDITGYDLWDEFKNMRGRSTNGTNFTIQVNTGMATLVWHSTQSIGEVISDDPQSPNYVSEDATFHCKLIRAEGASGDIVGVEATLVQ